MAPLFGVRMVTEEFRVGYLTGIQEAHEAEAWFEGEAAGLGCVEGYIVARTALQTNSTAEQVTAACTNPHPEAHPQGRLFSEWRLKETQLAAEHLHDPREVELFRTAFVVGYNMGFAHGWASVDQEKRAETVAAAGCSDAVWRVSPKLTEVDRAATAGKCAAVARNIAAKHGHSYKCILANNELNGQLSGQATRYDCVGAPTAGERRPSSRPAANPSPP
jgi:hypothetical protein